MKEYLLHTWVNPKLISDKSKIHGDGVFANEAITAGENGGQMVSGTIKDML